jgi:hypothetical protein
LTLEDAKPKRVSQPYTIQYGIGHYLGRLEYQVHRKPTASEKGVMEQPNVSLVVFTHETGQISWLRKIFGQNQVNHVIWKQFGTQQVTLWKGGYIESYNPKQPRREKVGDSAHHTVSILN